MRPRTTIVGLSLAALALAACAARAQDAAAGAAAVEAGSGGYVDAPLAPEGLPPLPGGTTPAPGGTLPGGMAIDSGAPPEGVRPADGERGQPELLPGVIDAQIKKCWSVPVMTGDPAEGGIARIRVKLLPDGRLEEPPAIIDKPMGRLGTVFAESAARAITKCAPYRLPPEQYQSWRELMLHFDTLDF